MEMVKYQRIIVWKAKNHGRNVEVLTSFSLVFSGFCFGRNFFWNEGNLFFKVAVFVYVWTVFILTYLNFQSIFLESTKSYNQKIFFDKFPK